jgi:hypothetical protein
VAIPGCDNILSLLNNLMLNLLSPFVNGKMFNSAFRFQDLERLIISAVFRIEFSSINSCSTVLTLLIVYILFWFPFRYSLRHYVCFT